MCLVRSRLTLATRILAVALIYVAGGANAATVKVADLTGTVVRKNDGLTVQRSAQLNSGDHIVASSQDARVLLECAGGATQMLTEGFDAVIVGTGQGVACAVDLNQGTAVATTAPQADGATGATIKTGDVTLGARSTQFGISVRLGANGAKAIECFVVEGEVTVGGWAAIKTLNTAQSVRVGDPTVKPISDAKYELLASSYAELATSRAPNAAQTTTLKNAYLRSFRNPADSEARLALATRQQLVTPGSSMSRYQEAHAKNLQGAVAVAAATPVGAGGRPALDKMLEAPREKGYRIDVCRVWAAECGQPAADAWCQLKGQHRARSYSIEQDIGASDPTIVLGSGQLCREAYCDAFARIVCE